MNPSTLSLSCYDRVPPLDCYQAASNPLEIADRMVERFIDEDNALPQLIDKLNITSESGPTVSGLNELDYLSSLHLNENDGTSSINQFKLINKIPLPPEIVEQCGNIQGGFTMGMFPEISRAWLTVESDIYLWNFENGGDVAYFDGLSEPIVSVGLVSPRKGIFQAFISHLLVLTTPMEITVLGVILAVPPDKKTGDELQLTPDIIYSLPTDGVPMNVVKGTKLGRIFLGGRDGNLYELVYRKEMSWGGKRAWKVNHTKGVLSYLVPNFVSIALSDSDAISDIAIDDSRNVLFTLTEKGSIEVFDLGPKGDETSRIASLSYSVIARTTFEMIRNLPVPDISQVVCLCPLGEHDSPHIGLVAITQTGFRLYITTGSPTRPTTLSILHIRAPSGYAPGTIAMAPALVTKGLHKSGTFLMVTSGSEMLADKIWCYTSDGLSVLRTTYTETIFNYNLAPAVSLGEARTNINLAEFGLQGHIFVYQQNYPQDRFIILTQQGADIYEKMRPVDIFSELLRERGGPDGNEVKSFFTNQGPDQVCAMALILACNVSSSNEQLAEWATRAFFLYGGEPRYTLQPVPQSPPLQSPPQMSTLQQTLLHQTLPPGFRPSTVSTPLGERQAPRSIEATYCVSFSSKHNGLYLYLSRLLRPIWNRKLVSLLQDSNKQLVYSPCVAREIISTKTVQLHDLRHFLSRHTYTQSSDFGASLQGASGEVTVVSPTGQRTRHQEAFLQEKHSLEALRTFVDHATQVLAAWKVLLDHDFQQIIESLPKDKQDLVVNVSFRDLVLKEEDLCLSLINSLITLYLKDNASVDSISATLRDACPSLYRSEDATLSKVNEILQLAKDVIDDEVRINLLRSAIELCKSVSPHINLEAVCKGLMKCGYYEGVLEMCHDVADKSDPQQLAAKYILRGRPSEDVDGSKAFATRHATYKEIVSLLDFLYQQCQVGGSSETTLFGSNITSEAQKLLELTLEKCLSVEDECCHIVVYDWLVSRDFQASLVSLGRPSLERFLSRYPVDSPLRDLLWQYHEKSGNHAAAAQILYKLATIPGESINLHQRLTYLGKAVMCMRSDEVGCTPHLGVFLHELEDLVQVARIQKQIHDRIFAMKDNNGSSIEACRKLNANLLSINELYESFAEPFGLWESKLSILDYAGHDDKELINSIWDNIIIKELDQCTSRDPSDQMTVLMSKIKSLGLQFTPQSPCFPTEYLVWQLELINCKFGTEKSHVHSTMTSLGVHVMALLDIYSKMYSANDRCWHEANNEFHLIQVIASFTESFSDNSQLVPSSQERKSVAVQMQDLINECITVLHSKPGGRLSELITCFKRIQTKLNRI